MPNLWSVTGALREAAAHGPVDGNEQGDHQGDGAACLRARKRERTRTLDELCALTGCNRSYAARLPRLRARSPATPAGTRRRKRSRTYGSETRTPLRKLWAVAGGICGKRLAPFLAELVPALERHGELELTDEQRAHLLAISAASIDPWGANTRRLCT